MSKNILVIVKTHHLFLDSSNAVNLSTPNGPEEDLYKQK